MKNLGKVRSSTKPNAVELTDKLVFLATNITPYTETIDDYVIEGYEYDYRQFDKDEYISYLQEQVIETQEAVCELYETLGGNLL